MQDTLVLTLVTVIGLLICGVMMLVVYRRRNPKAAKTKGRDENKQAAIAALRRFARDNDFKFIAPAHVSAGGATARLDAVAVGYFGVIGLIALGYTGEVYGSANDAEWLQVGADGARQSFANPAKEAAAAVRVIRDALFAAGQKKAPVEVAYVFSGPDVQLALPRSMAPMKVKDFKAYLGKERFLEDKGLDLDKVADVIKDALVG